MTNNIILTFRKDLQINAEEGNFYFQTPVQDLLFRGLSGGMRKVVDLLVSSGGSEDFLSEIVLREDGDSGLAKFYYCLQRFIQRGLICYSIPLEEEVLATYVPFLTGKQFNCNQFDKKLRYRLSRFAYSRREGRHMVLESPLANGRIVLSHWQASSMLSLLSEACSIDKITGHFPDISKQSFKQFLMLLLHAGMVEKVGDDARPPEERNEILQQWEFHDLLFHSRSRMGRHNQPVGGTFRFLNKINPLPVEKGTMSEKRITLYKPDMSKLQDQDYPFSLVLEQRKSIRDYADDPITVEQLGELLYRSARIKEVHKANPAAGFLYDSGLKPSPGAGALHELEIYLCVNECNGLEAGLYHYDAVDHELEKLSPRTAGVEQLLKECSMSAGLKGLPQISVHIAARFQRVAWKYQSIAYSLILKDVGVFYQTLYLVATAMDLAPSALGSGSADLLCQAAGLNYLEESCVGEFILGSKRV